METALSESSLAETRRLGDEIFNRNGQIIINAVANRFGLYRRWKRIFGRNVFWGWQRKLYLFTCTDSALIDFVNHMAATEFLDEDGNLVTKKKASIS